MNLITNASDAVGERGGRITIRTAVLHADAQYLRATYVDDELPPGTYVTIEVADTGIGMESTTAARMFDPFFTTKGDGRGLSMASVLGIVRSHRGAVKVYSKPGEGTSVKLLFPVEESGVAPPPVVQPTVGATTATVLVVDDDKSVRAVAVDMLEVVGWNVVSAADGDAAIQALTDHRDEVGVVLLDYMMPGMPSADVVTELKRLAPEIPIILSSGYAESEETATFPDKGLAGFLQKPCTIAVLSEVVNEALTPTD